MITRNCRLNYPPSLLREPIISQLIQRFDLTANILQAHISLEEGWLEIELIGEPHTLKVALLWLEDSGIEVVDLA